MSENEALVPALAADNGRASLDSTVSSVSTTSLVFERIHDRLTQAHNGSSKRGTAAAAYKSNTQRHANGAAAFANNDADGLSDFDDEDPLKEEDPSTNDLETGPFLGHAGSARDGKPMDRTLRLVVIAIGAFIAAAWLGGLAVFLLSKSYQHASAAPHDPQATASPGNGKDITLDQVMSGFWRAKHHSISWVAGPDGEDGLLLERAAEGKDYLVVEDVRAQKSDPDDVIENLAASRTLMKDSTFSYDGARHEPTTAVPSRDLQRVLLTSDVESNWRHSSTGIYWLYDVKTAAAEPLVPGEPGARLQLATWSPTSDAVVYTRGNNMFLRRVGFDQAVQLTTDGGADVFNGVPDWVYEEEVLAGASATWWSDDGRFIAFLRTNETGVPSYPVQYFVSRPSGKEPAPGEESYPEVRQIKYPKAGAHNPVVDLFFYDVERGDVFAVDIEGGFADDDRLITAVVWAGSQVIIKETNRVSDVMRVVLVDVVARTGKTVRTDDVGKADGGWFEISQKTRYIPADIQKGRAADGYIDTVIYNDGDHLAYFSPLDNGTPLMLTTGEGGAGGRTWEVVDAPSAVDLERNLVYFVATKESSIQRHIYSVNLQGKNLTPVTDVTVEGYYGASFSSGSGYLLLSYNGPGIPWQKVISTSGNQTPYEHLVEDNAELADAARKHELPLLVYGTIEVDGVALNYVERRPPHFDPHKTYPVMFQQYSGPGSQTVAKTFAVDFQSYLAAGLGYVCVTVDGRGTGYIGREHRVVVRQRLGHWEAHDQIAAAQQWAAKPYVDAARLAIWGWSYGGFTTLKTLEMDAGNTFRYGMAVAPVTDWRFYDSVYTERYMLTPQVNPGGYAESAVRNASALGQNVRFLLMHGVADDNVHMQNSLALLDALDLAGVENYDVHVFPDSDHGIYFHNANKIVYDKLTNWLINAFNGEWLKTANAEPIDETIDPGKRD